MRKLKEGTNVTIERNPPSKPNIGMNSNAKDVVKTKFNSSNINST